MRAIINGLRLLPGHPDAWRRGEILPQEHAALVALMCPPRGRERKARKLLVSPADLLQDTPSVRAKIAEHFGITYPDD
jgi:hypothetical protein